MPDEPFTLAGGESWETRMVRDWLRKPFKPEQIGKLPATAKRPALDFVGHAAVTDRLNKIAPDWTYTIDNMSTIGDTLWIRGTMTIGGVSRPDFGDGKDPKEAIGNFIRRAAMRFGVAIDLWSREELESSPARSDEPQASARAGDTTSPAGGPAAAGIPTTETRPRTSPQAGAMSAPSRPVGAGTSASGEAAGEEPGGQTNPPGSTKPCDHRSASGRWLPTRQVDGVPRCPRCGESALIYRETA